MNTQHWVSMSAYQDLCTVREQLETSWFPVVEFIQSRIIPAACFTPDCPWYSISSFFLNIAKGTTGPRVECCWQNNYRNKTRPIVNNAKDSLGQLFLIPFLVWSGKEFHLWFWSFWRSQQLFSCVFSHSAMVTPNETNNQVILVQASSWPVRRQSFAIQTIYNKLFLSFDKNIVNWR